MVCPNCGKMVKKMRPGWGCSCEKFYIPAKRLEKAVLAAYEQLEDNTDPVTAEIKKEHPKMETIEYWWLKKLVDRLSFNEDGSILTVHWLCGQKTEVPTGYNRMAADLKAMKKARESKMEDSPHPEPEVRKIHKPAVGR